MLRDKKYLEEMNQLINEAVMEYAAYPYARDTMHEISIPDLQITVADDIFLDFVLMKIT